jgi:hypothetical protein
MTLKSSASSFPMELPCPLLADYVFAGQAQCLAFWNEGTPASLAYVRNERT